MVHSDLTLMLAVDRLALENSMGTRRSVIWSRSNRWTRSAFVALEQS